MKIFKETFFLLFPNSVIATEVTGPLVGGFKLWFDRNEVAFENISGLIGGYWGGGRV